MRIAALILIFLLPAPLSAGVPIVHLKISGHALAAEVAYTPESRERGLMYRQRLDENSGMLFVFTKPDRYSMWMVNTDIPLSIAFLDEKGIILNIADMKPRTRTGHSSAGLAKYAIETNLGWFKKRQIKAGDRVAGLETAPPAE